MIFAEFEFDPTPYALDIPRIPEEQLLDPRKRLLDIGSGLGGISLAKPGIALIDPLYELDDPAVADLVASSLIQYETQQNADAQSIVELLNGRTFEESDELPISFGNVLDQTQDLMNIYKIMRAGMPDAFIPMTIQKALDMSAFDEGFDIITSRGCIGNALEPRSPLRVEAIEVIRSLFDILNRNGNLCIGPINGGMVDARKLRDLIVSGTKRLKGTITALQPDREFSKIILSELMRAETGVKSNAPGMYSLTFQKT